MNTGQALSFYPNDSLDFTRMISLDEKKGDPESLRNFLLRLSKEEKGISNILKLKSYPYFAGLCKWMKSCANCQRFETAIIGDDNSIKICWNSEPIGVVGSPVSEIMRNLEEASDKKQQERGCNDCFRKNSCVKCPFPSPLSDVEFCKHQKEDDPSSKAEQIRAFDIFKGYQLSTTSTQ